MDPGRQTLSSPGLSRDGPGGTLATSFPCYGPGKLLGVTISVPNLLLTPLPCPHVHTPLTPSRTVSECERVCAHVHLRPRGDAQRNRPPWEGCTGVLQDLRRSHPRGNPRGGVRPAGAVGTNPVLLDSAHLPGRGLMAGWTGTCISPAPRGRAQALSSGRVWWTPARGHTGLPPACRPGLTITAKSAGDPRMRGT